MHILILFIQNLCKICVNCYHAAWMCRQPVTVFVYFITIISLSMYAMAERERAEASPPSRVLCLQGAQGHSGRSQCPQGECPQALPCGLCLLARLLLIRLPSATNLVHTQLPATQLSNSQSRVPVCLCHKQHHLVQAGSSQPQSLQVSQKPREHPCQRSVTMWQYVSKQRLQQKR